MPINLISPSADRESDFMDFISAFDKVGESDYVHEEVLSTQGFTAYLDWLRQGERGELPELAPWSAFWAIESNSNALVGISSLRHTLTPWLAEFGGHIGYRVHPAYRRRGYATEILRLTLAKANLRGINNVLIVCTPDNIASQGVLQKAGAQFEREALGDSFTRLRYWLPTSAQPEVTL